LARRAKANRIVSASRRKSAANPPAWPKQLTQMNKHSPTTEQKDYIMDNLVVLVSGRAGGGVGFFTSN
jgi:hypothetical protein